MKQLHIAIALSLCFTHAALAQDGASTKDTASAGPRSLVVLPFEGKDASAEQLEALRLRTESTLRTTGAFTLFSLEELKSVSALAEDRFKTSCTEDAGCLAELTQALGKDLAVHGSLGKLDAVWVLNVRLVDGKGAKVIARDRVTGATLKDIEGEIAGLAKRLASEQSETQSVQLALSQLGTAPAFAVLGLQPQGVESSTAESLTDALAVELGQFEGVKVFTKGDIATMMAVEEGRQLMGCDDISCMVELGGALGARFVVTGTVSRLDDTFIVSTRIIDSTQVQVVATGTESFKGPVDELLIGMRFLVRRMFAVPIEGAGRLRLSYSHGGAELAMDGESLGESPEPQVPTQVPAGRHLLELRKEGYYPLSREVYVEPARVTSLDLQLKEIPVPWYRTWWFWTLTGVVVAGTTATAIAVSAESSDPPRTGGGSATFDF